MNETDKCPVCGTEGFGTIVAWNDLSPRNQWWYCAGCDDHWPVTIDEEE